jgi:predicted nucleic acid-binding protein
VTKRNVERLPRRQRPCRAVRRRSLERRAIAVLKAETPVLIVSDFAAAEFASAIARLVRIGRVNPRDVRIAFTKFDGWMARTAASVEAGPADVAAGAAFLRRLEVNLRTPDAINIAIAQRVGATLVTFDTRMADSAHALGCEVAPA